MVGVVGVGPIQYVFIRGADDPYVSYILSCDVVLFKRHTSETL